VSVGRLGSALVAVLLLAACGGAQDNRPYDAADVLFATEMIPHHEQAVAMAKLAPGHGASRQVLEVASQISAEQIPEIAQLQGMLAEWDQPAAATAVPMGAMPGMNGGMDARGALAAAAPGMMSDDEMTQLESATGPAFDHAFLQMMITHHQGALTMAKSELADGRDQDAMLMAQNISDAQQVSIDLMRQLLARR
jgi:uncharacterized protein (DUF305 family)